MNQINVLHIDDSMMILDAVENYFQQFEDIGIIGRAQDGESALALARKIKPDIILLDINLPDINGIDLISPLRKTLPDVKFLVLTMHEGSAYRQAAQRAKADGYILKRNLGSELVPEIRRVANTIDARGGAWDSRILF